jgi:hypothetical protein
MLGQQRQVNMPGTAAVNNAQVNMLGNDAVPAILVCAD